MKRLIASLLLTACFGSPALAELKVVVSIKPLHSLVSRVMAGTGQPSLLVDGANSPHTFSLKPSAAAALQNADAIFWIGHELEAFLEKPLKALGEKSRHLAVMEATGVQTLNNRENNIFEHADHDKDHGHEHEHGERDGHIWLDPKNAKAIVSAVASELASIDPANAALYAANASAAVLDISTLETELEATIAPARGKDFMVFHDAYHYFEDRFGLASLGTITLNPETTPGAATIAKLQQRLQQANVGCVFSEPQFDSKLVSLVMEGSSAKTAVLDPLGADLAPGPGLYAAMMKNLGQSFATCLAK
jgi:zinc transport system substrate-binding protein